MCRFVSIVCLGFLLVTFFHGWTYLSTESMTDGLCGIVEEGKENSDPNEATGGPTYQTQHESVKETFLKRYVKSLAFEQLHASQECPAKSGEEGCPAKSGEKEGEAIKISQEECSGEEGCPANSGEEGGEDLITTTESFWETEARKEVFKVIYPLIGEHGKTEAMTFNPFFDDHLQTYPLSDSENLYVFCGIGPQNAGKSTFYNLIFGSSFPTMSDDAPAYQRTTHGVDVQVLQNQNRNWVLLDVEGVFGSDRALPVTGSDKKDGDTNQNENLLNIDNKLCLFCTMSSNVIFVHLREILAQSTNVKSFLLEPLIRAYLDIYENVMKTGTENSNSPDELKSEKSDVFKRKFVLVVQRMGETRSNSDETKNILMGSVKDIWKKLTNGNLPLDEHFELDVLYLKDLEHKRKDYNDSGMAFLKKLEDEIKEDKIHSFPTQKHTAQFSSLVRNIWEKVDSNALMNQPHPDDLRSMKLLNDVLDQVKKEINVEVENGKYDPSINYIEKKVNTFKERIEKDRNPEKMKLKRYYDGLEMDLKTTLEQLRESDPRAALGDLLLVFFLVLILSVLCLFWCCAPLMCGIGCLSAFAKPRMGLQILIGILFVLSLSIAVCVGSVFILHHPLLDTSISTVRTFANGIIQKFFEKIFGSISLVIRETVESSDEDQMSIGKWFLSFVLSFLKKNDFVEPLSKFVDIVLGVGDKSIFCRKPLRIELVSLDVSIFFMILTVVIALLCTVEKDEY